MSGSWLEYDDEVRGRFISVRFRKADCQACPALAACAPGKSGRRQLRLHGREEQEALESARERTLDPEAQGLYALRSGVEGTISQAVRAFGLRQARYRGLAKTRLQHVATAAALDLDPAVAWLEGRPLAPTRTSRFLALAA